MDRVRAGAAVALSAVLHLVTWAVAVGGVLLVVLGWETVVQPVLGLILLGLAVHLRPPADPVDADGVLRRTDAPRLFSLLDDIARALGGRSCDAVRLTPGFEVRAVRHGLRGTRLDLGLALWATLTPQQRVACLAQALAGLTGTDVSRHLLVRTALRIGSRPVAPSDDSAALRERAFATPRTSRRTDDLAEAAGRFRVDNALSRWTVWLVTWPLRQVVRLVRRLVAPLAAEAERRSDASAAEVASTEAAVAALTRREAAPALDTELRRLAVEARAFGREDASDALWGRLASHTANLPAAPSPGGAARSRAGLLAAAEPRPARVTLDPEAAAALERELEPAGRAVARRYIRDVAGLPG
ncbi:hypothetical protein [Streptomyces sp. NPDC053367]|uniref:hypothetical protein n=1 Tax=Streptomyces sp. NPDC053367 TaxID=3365700 RepID=UPI0037D82A6F